MENKKPSPRISLYAFIVLISIIFPGYLKIKEELYALKDFKEENFTLSNLSLFFSPIIIFLIISIIAYFIVTIIKNDEVVEKLSDKKECAGILDVFLGTTFIMIVMEILIGIIIFIFTRSIGATIDGFKVGSIIGFLIGIFAYGISYDGFKNEFKKEETKEEN